MTGHLFNIINEAIYDTVASVEEAVLEAYHPNSENMERAQVIHNQAYPTRDEIAKSLNSLETLLCSGIDNQFDLLEIWLHRNVFTFPNLTRDIIRNFKFDHMNLWDQFIHSHRPQTSLDDVHQDLIIEPDWEKMKQQEEELWFQLDKSKTEFIQVSTS